jgi:hypothetical protein
MSNVYPVDCPVFVTKQQNAFEVRFAEPNTAAQVVAYIDYGW